MDEGLSRRDLRIPDAGRGQVVGLYGGSFNPPHEGHLLVAERATRRLALDAVWWLVTPGNPLKDHGDLEPLARRLAAVRKLGAGPHHRATAFEAAYRVRYTADTIRIARARSPHLRFVWIMGADSLTGFHRWQDWEEIARSVPIAIIDRPGDTLSTLSSKFAIRYARFRVPEHEAADLAYRKAPAWTFLHGARTAMSSSTLRDLRRG
ncbi:nicotinate-nucleotide adenylyltransferase [Fulvimarina sp. 2208YS6-2-32]|uniref:Probable nicotinate-nucleotide adenylyltransferase n=1 Tax=Fulvimarina uroteuthidis TaxID=3098149 RepID=A0ABU5I1P4_9HYPH|nr:nicotinate-nucleotide adenylyltransferase [Fulvimarina sp. 2208YS6-2-32]MDY8108683.1 nicotinate-nucleotide adenylyltransferase [Fulvimarina sp. 2208YS6-2-32]